MSETKPSEETVPTREVATPPEESNRSADAASGEDVSVRGELPRVGAEAPDEAAPAETEPDETQPDESGLTEAALARALVTAAEQSDAAPVAATADAAAADAAAAEAVAPEAAAPEAAAPDAIAAEPNEAEPEAELRVAGPAGAVVTAAGPVAAALNATSLTATPTAVAPPEGAEMERVERGGTQPDGAEPNEVETAQGEAVSAWRIVAEWSGLTRAPDLPYLFWPLLWAGWFASEGAPRWPRLLALVIAVVLARSAAWVAYVPEAPQLSTVLRERWPLFISLAIGALCFALPLGWAGMLVPVSLALLAGWFELRQRSYLSDPVLILAVAAPAAAGWLIQGAPLTKATGLLWLAIFLWLAAALIATPLQRNTANLAALSEPHAPFYSAGLKLLALSTLFLAGRQAHLGIFFQLGMATALALLIYDLWASHRGEQLKRIVFDAWWGTAVFCGIAFHFLCACQVAAKV